MDSLGPVSHGTLQAPVARPAKAVSVLPLDGVTLSGAFSASDGDAAAQINRLLRGHTDRREERQILDILRGCEGTALDETLQRVDLQKLCHGIDDHSGSQNHRTQLFDLLARQRLADLSIEVRAGLIDGMQDGRTDSVHEAAIRDIFLGTRGSALTDLKNRVDAGDNHHDLQQLIFHDIDDVAVKDAILRHIAAEATAASIKIASDVDDTFYRNWKDPRYPEKTVYPGVRAFYAVLDGGPSDADRRGDLCFISARPGERMGVNEHLTRTMLGERGVFDCVILTGDLEHIASNEKIAEKKHENLTQYNQLFPEYGLVLIGDSGQGDIMLGEKALAAQGAAVKAVFIHDVVATPQPARDALRARGIVLFDTYVDAAVEAHQLGLISRGGLQRVADSAVREMAAIRFDSDAQRAARQAELDAALARIPTA